MPDKNSDNKALWMVVVILMAIAVVVFALNPNPGYSAAAQQTTTGDKGSVLVDVAESGEGATSDEENLRNSER